MTKKFDKEKKSKKAKKDKSEKKTTNESSKQTKTQYKLPYPNLTRSQDEIDEFYKNEAQNQKEKEKAKVNIIKKEDEKGEDLKDQKSLCSSDDWSLYDEMTEPITKKKKVNKSEIEQNNQINTKNFSIFDYSKIQANEIDEISEDDEANLDGNPIISIEINTNY